MKKNNSLKTDILNSLSTFLIFLCLCFICYNCYAYLSCYNIAKKIPAKEEQEFIRLKIYGSSYTDEGNTVSGTVSIIDSNGNEIAVIERSWSGSYLAVEFNQCQFAGTSYFFPNRIYGTEKITEKIVDRRKGTSLEKYYDENGQCMLLGYGSTLKERQNIYKMARFVTGKLPVFDFGKRNNYIIDLSPCKIEVYYSIKRDRFGNLVIEEL